ncbi:hypothetical protein GCM10009810_17580 [Nostocoides vanveenii]|uniref:Uncharacterized protein n=1 Tax=Nostocoides vanveenii TaxID=330835 RepID=A0ABN2KLM0_9MICO
MRLYADAVGGVQVREPEGGHRGDQARAAGPVPTDLDPVARDAFAIGGVDDPRGEPEDALRDLIEKVPSGRSGVCGIRVRSFQDQSEW